jgi:Domain of unknown function (DUF5610)
MNGISSSFIYERESLSLQASLQAYSANGSINSQGNASSASGLLGDVAEFGGSAISLDISLEMVVERTTARIQSSLGGQDIPVGDATSFGGMADFSPEAVSSRIVDFATGFLGAFTDNHSEQPEGAAVSEFESLIRGAIEEGFNQARDIIEAMSAMTTEVGGTIDQTFELTMQKLDAFFAQLRDGMSEDTLVIGQSDDEAVQASVEYYEEKVSVSLSLTYTETSQIAQTESTGENINISA